MIKIEKDLTTIPCSLLPAYLDLFPGETVVPRVSETTHQKRLAVIAAGRYTDTDSFNSRYKLNDIREPLVRAYKSKCAFCEQKVEQYQIEHYRPKRTYYWLAYSWDNLLLSCPTCNGNKGIHFELGGTQVSFTGTPTNLRIINISSAGYDAVELPSMVNPEVTDPSGRIAFSKDGNITSMDPRFAYTIRICEIDRVSLKDARRRLLSIFKEHIISALFECSTAAEQAVAIATIIRNFIADSKNPEMEYLAFRRYAISSEWLSEIIKEAK